VINTLHILHAYSCSQTGGTSVARFLLELTQRGLFGRFARIDEAWLNNMSAHVHTLHRTPPHHRTRAKLGVYLKGSRGRPSPWVA
jgi:hypothetical protein